MYAFPHLSRLIATDMFSKLVAMMPPPSDPSPEGRRNRDIVAMCMLKQMGPILTVEEASLAITIVAADAHAHDAFRGAAENAGDLKVVMQCRAQANTMMRTRHKAAAALEALIRCRPLEWQPQSRPTAEEPSAESAAPNPPPHEPTPGQPDSANISQSPADKPNTHDQTVSHSKATAFRRTPIVHQLVEHKPWLVKSQLTIQSPV